MLQYHILLLITIVLVITFKLISVFKQYLPVLFVKMFPNQLDIGKEISMKVPECLLEWRSKDGLDIRRFFNQTVGESYLRPKPACPQALASLRFYSAFHQPHFSEHFFLFTSMVLWQKELYGYATCIRYLSIPDSVTEFWSDYSAKKQTWAIQMIDAMRPYYGDFVLSNSFADANNVQLIDDKRNLYWLRWFLHPSDAVTLTAHLLQTDPCVHRGSATHRRASPMVVTILQRQYFRRMLNLKEVKATLEAALHRRIVSAISIVTFDGKTLKAQAEIMYKTDIFVTIHGAGQTNVAFMRPCSVVLEICPFAYCEVGITQGPTTYFGTLAHSTGLIYFRYTEPKENSILPPDTHTGGGSWSGNSKRCGKVYGALPSSDAYAATASCQPDKHCRECSRMTDVLVNSTVLRELTAQAVAKRDECILTHPFYS